MPSLRSRQVEPRTGDVPFVYPPKNQLRNRVSRVKETERSKLAMDYFRWVERTTGESHTNEAYTRLLMIISNSRKYDLLENVLQEMSLLGYGISSNACINLTGVTNDAKNCGTQYSVYLPKIVKKIDKIMLCKIASMMSTAGYDAQLKLMTRKPDLPNVPEDINSLESTPPYSTPMPPHPDGLFEAPNVQIVINAALDYIDTVVSSWEREEPGTQPDLDDSFEYDISHEDLPAPTQTQTDGGQTVAGETSFFDYVFHGDQTQGKHT